MNLPGNLPVDLPSLPGREADIAKVSRWLEQCRVVTLLGPGVSEKTTLAMHVAANLRASFPDGVFHVRMNQVSRPDALFQAILSAMDIREMPLRSPVEAAREVLSRRKVLLILDDFEQVSGAANVVSELARSTQGPYFLIISRDLVQFPVGLVMVLSEQPATFDGLGHYARQYQAVNFLVARLRVSVPTFELTDANARDLLVVCAYFSAIPMSVELIAAQAKSLLPQDILDQLVNRLEADLLRHALPVQSQPLQSLLSWIAGLLAAVERECLWRLGVFASDFAPRAAQEICQDGALSGIQILDCLQVLLQRGLLRLNEDSDGQERFFLLEGVREYALRQLDEQKLGETMRRQHARYYMQLAEQAEPELIGEQQATWSQLLEAEYPNLRAAMLWSIEREETELALRLTGALYRYWNRRGYFSEGSSWLEKAVALPGDVPLPRRIKVERCLGALKSFQNDTAGAEQHFGECLRLARLHGDPGLVAQALNGVAIMAHEQHKMAEARSYYEEGLALARSSDNQVAACNLLCNLAVLAMSEGRYDDTEACFTEARAIEQARGDALGVARILTDLAFMNISRGRLDEAQKLIQNDVFSQIQDSPELDSRFLHLQGVLSYHQGDLTTARQKFTRSQSISQGLQEKASTLDCLTQLGVIASDLGEFDVAKQHLEEAAELVDAHGSPAAFASLLYAAAGFAIARRHFAEAARLYAAADEQRSQTGEVYPEIDKPKYERNVNLARTQLGEAQFQAFWQAGQSMVLADFLPLIRSIE